jgi:hypothetical protein
MPDTKSLVLDPEPPVPDPEPPVPDPKPLVPDPEPGGAFSKGSSESEYNNNGGQNFEESSDSSGAIDEQIVRFAEEMVGLFGFGHVVSEVEIVRFINGRYGTDFVAIRPGDYCYNLIYGAADKRNKPKVFEMLGDGFYKCLGASYNYYDNLTSSKGLADERREDWKSQDKLMDLSAAGPLLSERGGRLEQDEEESLRFEERFGRFLMNYSESIQTRQKFFGLLRDIFPQHRLQTNLLSILHEIGIASEIEDSQRIDSAFAFRFEKRLTEEYGIAQNYAEWAVSVWCEYYGKRALGKQCDISARRAEYRDA